MMRSNRIGRFFQQNQYAIASLVLFLAVAGMTGIYVANRINVQRQELAQKQAQLNQELALEEEESKEEDLASVNSVIKPRQKEETKKQEIVAKETASPEPQAGQDQSEVVGPSALHFSPESDLQWPLKGKVLINYSMDQTVYFATLDQYKHNPAMVIAGDINAPVYAAADGRITGIGSNEETGTTVTMDLGDGYSAVYGQLKEVLYKEGAFVEAGAAIGYVAEPTKYYSVEGSNLYFQMLKDGKPVDPTKYLE